MNASRTTPPQAIHFFPAEESKPGFRTKTISTRLPPDELAEVEAAAERAGQPLSEWLRATALRAARERPADPMELLLAEVWAVRHAVLSLFYAGAKATVEGKPMLPESVLSIRDQGDAKKLERARVLLATFLARPIGKDGERR